jgi:hypothetical protein
MYWQWIFDFEVRLIVQWPQLVTQPLGSAFGQPLPVSNILTRPSLSNFMSFNSFHMYQLTKIDTAIIIGLILVVVLVLCGYKRYPGGMPMGATCSAVISAACHPPLPEDKDAFKIHVQWGAISHPNTNAQRSAENLNAEISEGSEGSESSGSGVDDESRVPTETESRLEDIISEVASSSQVEEISKTSSIRTRKIQDIGHGETGHCCFTTARDVEPPRTGLYYA